MRTRGDLFAGLFFLSMGIGFAVGAIRLSIGRPTEPQPGFFPFLDGIILVGLSGIFLFQTRGNQRRESPSSRRLWRPGLVTLGMALYVAALDTVGYVIATTLLAAIVLRVLETRSIPVLILASLVLSIFSFVLFDRFLGVPLPIGFLAGLW